MPVIIVHVVFFELKTVEVPQLLFLDKVIDVFFVQFIDGVDVPVIMQRRGLLSVLGKVVDMLVVFNDRCFDLSEQKTDDSAVAVLTLWSMSLLCRSSFGSLAGGASDSVHRQSW